jgi:hypothetical protein
MVKCQYCDKRARYGTEQLGPIACGDHKTFDLEDVVTKKCYYSGCKKRATHGINKSVSCGEHAYPGYSNLNVKKCKYCEELATHGMTYGNATVCRGHANSERDVRHKECSQQGCHLRASFTDDRCSKHSETKDRKEKNKLCQYCTTLASFAYQSIDKPIRCKAHKDEGMINVRLRKRQNV